MLVQWSKYQIQKILPAVIHPPQLRNFINFNKKLWANYRQDKNAQAEILVDSFGLYETEIARGYFVNVLAKRFNASVASFSSRAGSPAVRDLYSSFGINKHILTYANAKQKARAKLIFDRLRNELNTKQAVHDLTLNGIWIGVEVYEEYLARYSRPTIDFNDQQFWDVLFEGLCLMEFWDEYFQNHQVKAIVVSHDCYLAYGLICKVAYKASIPVYLCYPTYITRVNQPFTRFNYFYNYPKLFAKLPLDKQRAVKADAKEKLDRRFSGEIGVDMAYSTKSAYKRTGSEKRVLRESNNLKVLICSHCFFDSPHAFGELLFPDFYEWIHFLGKVSEKTNYDWYLKTHPDPLPGTSEAMKDILQHYPRIKMIDPTVSHPQLVDEGIHCVLTVFGTVGHEYPAMGKWVINAGYNPHVAYDFNLHPKTVAEYEQILLNLEKLPPMKLNWDAFYEFYYMYHYGCDIDNLVYPSYKKMVADLGKNRFSAEVLAYFQSNHSTDLHDKIISNFNRYLDSGEQHAFYLRGSEGFPF